MVLAAAALLAGCHHNDVADVTLEADEAARNATAAKTIADLAAADQAARAPMPRNLDRPAAPASPAASPAETQDTTDGADSNTAE